MPCLELLESRQLLAIVSAVNAQGALSVISDAADPIALGTNGLGDVTINGANPGTGAFPSAMVTGIAIQGGPGANRIDFSAFQIASFPVLTTLTVDGGGGNDVLVAPDAATNFNVTASDSGILGGTAFGSIAVSTFTAVPNLTGGAAPNDFLFGPGASLSGAIQGGSSGNSLDLGAMNGPLSVVLTGSTSRGFQGTASFIAGGFSQITTMNGPLDQGTLTGENVPSTWTLNDAPTYSDGTNTLAFQNFQTLQAGNGGDTFEIIGNAVDQVTANLLGGSGADTFNFQGAAQLVGSLYGNGGFDTLSYAAFGSSVNVQITGSDASGYSGTEALSFSGGGFHGIDNVIASPSAAGSSILTGEDVISTWNLGASQTYSDGSVTPLSFSGFAILQGGSAANTFNVLASTTADLNGGAGDDSFVFSNGAVLHGSIDGQAGVNTLDLSGYNQATQVNLAAETASMLDGTLANIRDVIGGTAADTITGDSADNTIVSNGTNDLLAGGPGNDTYVLTLPPSSSTSVTDNQGNNTLDFSRAGTGITLNLGSTAVQTVASGRQLQINGIFTNVIGTPFADVISASATTYDRTISGGPAGSASGDILRVDAGGRVASVTPTAVLIEGMGTIYYSHFSQVILFNQALSDLVLSQSSSPAPARLHLPLTIVLTVTNQGPSIATQVVLTDDLPTSMTYVSASSSQGSVQVAGNTLTGNLGSLAVGATATVHIILTPQAVGSTVNTAAVVAHQPNPNPDHARSSQTITVVNSTLQIVSQSRRGSGYQPTSVILQFNEPLNASSASNLSHYELIDLGPDKKLGSSDNRPIRILAAVYNAAADTVTLLPRARLALSVAYFVEVRGVTSVYGNVLDGYGNNTPGSPYYALFHGYNKFRHLLPPQARR
ncbi:MAG: hypothetical protein ABSH35_12310 [Isosphaeraceae bacterium]|jgi:uncharacterized repeat protein (TIGR01451 family)